MRIIGGHDYYDSALAYGRDDDVIFVREPKIVPDKECPLFKGYPHAIIKGRSYWGSNNKFQVKENGQLVTLELHTINCYVAGKHYGAIKVKKELDSKHREIFWNYDAFVNWLSSLGKEVAGPAKKYKWEKDTPEKDAFTSLKAFLTPMPATLEQLAWLVNNRVVTATWYDNYIRNYVPDLEWRCNSTEKGYALKDIEFARAVDPFTLFQEISMFVGGVLPRNANPMVEIVDQVIKAEKHGFDKWSFRRHKDEA